MKKIRVRLPLQAHEIWVGNGILSQSEHQSFFKNEKAGKAFIIADLRLRPYARSLSSMLKSSGWSAKTFFVRVTEDLKSFHSIYPFYGKLLKEKADRNSVIFALGGGVIGDAVGFLAGTYLRGVRWVGVPTTLLAQVDSSVGGKTGINHDAGKNLIGVFHHPSLVICDTSVLRTLPSRDIVSGMGEIIKYGLIYDARLFLDVQRNLKNILALKPTDIDRVVHQCLNWKARVVARDERDTSGVREVLNFGHTLGHALEAESGYGYFRHGEAVILGMRAATYLSVLQGWLNSNVQKEIDAFLASLPVPSIPKKVKVEQILGRLKWDKKMRQGRVRFVLLKGVGKAVLDHKVPDTAVRETARWLLSVGGT